MTVRAWFTISALVLVALAIAFAFRVFGPVSTPGILARSGDVRLEGTLVESCWPGRSGKIACTRGDGARGSAPTVASQGHFRVLVEYYQQPTRGTIRIDGPERIQVDDWRSPLSYDLEPGTYSLTTEARYPQNAFIRYVFRFKVTRSGS